MRTYDVAGVAVPVIMYGTAWKEAETARLTRLAIDCGFRAIDTANQRKHYVENAVGFAVAERIVDGLITRDEVFLQTKFTYKRGQDHRLPYDAQADLATQVMQSFQRSLEHLRTSYVDAYLLHGPWSADGLSRQDEEVWRAFEAIYQNGQSGGTRLLGVSNMTKLQLEALWRFAAVKPALVQNRCYARDGWDADTRAFCRAHGLRYQGFSLLTANARELGTALPREIAKNLGRTIPEVIFRMALDLGMIVLTGTTSEAHMKHDLAAVAGLELRPGELQALERIGRSS